MPDEGVAPIRVLTVDDHPLFLRGVRDLIETSEDIVIAGETTSGLQAARLIMETEPDVAVLDVSLPETSGIALVRQILAEGGRTRCLLLSAHEDNAMVTQALAAGASGYLLKRSAGEHLLHGIRAVNANSLYIDPSIANRFGLGFDGRRALGERKVGRPLTEREREVVKLIAFGYSNKEIASRIGVTSKSVETYKMRASEKLEMRTRSKFVQYALLQGWFHEIQS